MLRETRDKTIEDYSNTSGQRVLSSNLGMNYPKKTTNPNSRPSSTISFATMNDDEENDDGVDDDDDDDISSILEDTLSPKSINSNHLDIQDLHIAKELARQERSGTPISNCKSLKFNMESNWIRRPPSLFNNHGKALKSLTRNIDTNSFKSSNSLEDMDEFPCRFSNENFDKDILSPTMSEKQKTSYDDITPSLKIPLSSFELAKGEIFVI
jgi:hypothetical protein